MMKTLKCQVKLSEVCSNGWKVWYFTTVFRRVAYHWGQSAVFPGARISLLIYRKNTEFLTEYKIKRNKFLCFREFHLERKPHYSKGDLTIISTTYVSEVRLKQKK